MISIRQKVGQGGQNLTIDLAKIQLALYALGILNKPDFEKEMIGNLMSTSNNDTKKKLFSNSISFSDKLDLLPTNSQKISVLKIGATIKSIHQFQTQIMKVRRSDGRIDPGQGTLRQLNKNISKLPPPIKVPETIPTSFETGATDGRIGNKNQVKVVGESIVINLSKNGQNEKKTILISASRQYIVENYNWNGIIKLMQIVYKKNKDKYVSPTNLKGLIEDDILIVPDLGIQYVVQQQLNEQLKKRPLKNNSLNTILKPIDGKPGERFLNRIIGKKRSVFFSEKSNKSFKDIFNNNKITIPSVKDPQDKLYSFFRSIVLSRNGLWSDNQGVVNVVGLRRILDKMSSTRYNDGIVVCWKDKNGQPHVELNIATTEPGNRYRRRQLEPQTMTMLAGYHNLRQPAGRTRNALKQSSNAGSVTWCKGDTTMNFHQGGNKLKFPNNTWLSSYGLDSFVQTGLPNRRFNKNEIFELNQTLSKIYLWLSKYGNNKSIAPYQYCKKLADSQPIGIEKTNNGQVTISQKGVTQKKIINIAEVKKWMVNYWYNKRLLPKNRLKIFTIIQKISGRNDAEINRLEKINKTKILAEISDDFIIKIIKKQMEFFPSINDIDGKAGPTFYKVVEDIRPSIAQAKKDFPKLEKLINQLENLPLRNVPSLKSKLKKGLHINTDANRTNVKTHTRYDEVLEINIIANATIGNWSAGCQVIYDTEVFYEFWCKLLDRAENSGQRRWYYTLIDATSWKKSDVL